MSIECNSPTTCGPFCRKNRRKGQGIGFKWQNPPSTLPLLSEFFFIRADLDSHLWGEALRGPTFLWTAPLKAQIASGILLTTYQFQRWGRQLRLVCGPLSGCMGLLVKERPGEPLAQLFIIRRLPCEGRETESVN